jgi:DNA repair exonuclease SbcCD ATPase subunit
MAKTKTAELEQRRDELEQKTQQRHQDVKKLEQKLDSELEQGKDTTTTEGKLSKARDGLADYLRALRNMDKKVERQYNEEWREIIDLAQKHADDKAQKAFDHGEAAIDKLRPTLAKDFTDVDSVLRSMKDALAQAAESHREMLFVEYRDTYSPTKPRLVEARAEDGSPTTANYSVGVSAMSSTNATLEAQQNQQQKYSSPYDLSEADFK